MFNLQIPIDPKLAAAIERRRLREEERKKRILDEKKRRIGIDIEALKAQIDERNRKETLKRMDEEKMEKEMLLRDEQAVQAYERERAQRRQLCRTVDRFRLVCQRPETQRDFDLYDPEFLRKSKPAREADFDPLCGPSSLQIFSGEDLWKNEREKKLKEVQKTWLEQQQQEKSSFAKRLRDVESVQDEESLRLSRMACEQMKAGERYRQKLAKDLQSFNQQLLHHKVSHGRLMKLRELEMNNVEMGNHIFSDILMEDPRMAISSFGPHRVIPDRWKGMSSEQVARILEAQRNQAISKKITEAVEKEEETAWDHQMLRVARSGLLRERQQERLRREHNLRLMEENLRLASEQKSAQDHLNRIVYRSHTANDFFTQFGQSCR